MVIKMINRVVVFEDGDNNFEVNQSCDNDICFRSLNPNLEFNFNFKSREIAEWKSYELFMSLMKQMIGDYVLEETSSANFLPKDFIDLENKTIIWHSDSGIDNVLKMKYCDDKMIISLIKDPNNSKTNNTYVRVRTSGSSYSYYYKYFLKFYKELLELMNMLYPPTKLETKTDTSSIPVSTDLSARKVKELQKEKKFSIFNRNK